MTPEEDILFLYISAPSVASGSIRPSFEPLDLVPIHAADLRQMLDDAGIRYRVIILSACAVDGFVEPLRGPGTLVVAASENGGHAWGCKGDAPYTDFGDAFLGAALHESFSPAVAFERARTLLAERSASDLRSAPNPAIFVGAEIAAKLDALDTRLESDNVETAPMPSAAAPAIRSSRTLQR
jgi:hypothetical protein